MQQIRARQLAEWLADDNRPDPVLLDVREPWELDLCQLAGTQHIPMHLVPVRCDDIDPNRDVVVICHHGGRSMQVAMFLERKGFRSVHNLMGGVEAWAAEVDPTMRRY
ncbi:rhodanese-like domain-containing protein [Dechloromonas agitata]|uniref:Sulfurtransferase n=1 Tax=Dechloromonas agitata TaxID=73030 RepID=A0A930FY77_9RHOO|nr:rhodanese-like domain-containing protein [Dechloromonas agitata]MBF1163771.1 sulfurtransferase [Dechloromonas agitata]MDE1546366.1 rhodanese-like domain-containing protein [Dechloromonas agitata]